MVLQWGSDKYKCSDMERLAAEQNCEVGARVAVRVWSGLGLRTGSWLGLRVGLQLGLGSGLVRLVRVSTWEHLAFCMAVDLRHPATVLDKGWVSG